MEDVIHNLLGSYGRWAAGIFNDKPGPLSYLNPRWSNVSKWKPQARTKVLELISMPSIEKKPDVRVEKSYQYDNLYIEELSWSLPYGPETKAVFLIPAQRKGSLPGILALHDHGGAKYFGKRKIIRTSKEVHPFISLHQKEYYGGVGWANEVAKRGYGVLIHDVFPFGSRRILASDLPGYVVKRMMTSPLEIEEVKPEDIEKSGSIKKYDVTHDEPLRTIKDYNAFAEQYEFTVAMSLFSAGLTWPGVFLAEDKYALDYLCSRSDIDENRIGCCGLSGGGLRTNYLSGLDDRIKCSVTAGFMTTWRDFVLNQSYNNNWMSCIPILPKFMDFPDIIGMRVPLPTLVFATKQDPLYNILEVERAGKILRQIYMKAKRTDAFRFSFYEGFHKFDLPMQEEAWSWLDQWLVKQPN